MKPSDSFHRRHRSSVIWSSCDSALLQSQYIQPVHNPILDEIQRTEWAAIQRPTDPLSYVATGDRSGLT